MGAKSREELLAEAEEYGVYESVKDMSFNELRGEMSRLRDEQDAEVAVNEPKKDRTITIVAKYKARNEEGDRVVEEYRGEGKTPREAIENVGFPQNMNILVNVTVTDGEHEYSRALAAYKTRDIFDNKNDALLCKLFGIHA